MIICLLGAMMLHLGPVKTPEPPPAKGPTGQSSETVQSKDEEAKNQ